MEGPQVQLIDPVTGATLNVRLSPEDPQVVHVYGGAILGRQTYTLESFAEYVAACQGLVRSALERRDYNNAAIKAMGSMRNTRL